MRLVVLFISLSFCLVFSYEAFACGGKKYELQTEVEINGKVYSPKIIAVDRETVVEKIQARDAVETDIQVLATELWNESHQGDAVELVFKISQHTGRRSLADGNLTIIAPYAKASELTVRGNEPNAKPARVKVTAEKI